MIELTVEEASILAQIVMQSNMPLTQAKMVLAIVDKLIAPPQAPEIEG